MATERPEVCSSLRNAVTAATGSPALSINRTGSQGSSRITTVPTAGTTNADSSQSRSASAAMAPQASHADASGPVAPRA